MTVPSLMFASMPLIDAWDEQLSHPKIRIALTFLTRGGFMGPSAGMQLAVFLRLASRPLCVMLASDQERFFAWTSCSADDGMFRVS